MKKNLPFIFMLILMDAYAGPKADGKFPSITSEIELEEFYNLPFAIVEEKRVGKFSEIVGKGTYQGATVGLRFKIEGHWEPAKEGEMFSLTGSIQLESIGKESDAFIRALARIYGIGGNKSEFRNSGPLDAIAFGGTEQDRGNRIASFKVFGTSDIEADYFEFFIEYEPKAKRIWLNEKDESYRKPLLKRIGK